MNHDCMELSAIKILFSGGIVALIVIFRRDFCRAGPGLLGQIDDVLHGILKIGAMHTPPQKCSMTVTVKSPSAPDTKPLSQSGNSGRAVNRSLKFYMSEAHTQAGMSLPSVALPGSGWARSVKSKPDSDRGPGRSPSPSQSGCKSRRWTGLRPVCWQRASSSGPSQTALCCARPGCCSVSASVPGNCTAECFGSNVSVGLRCSIFNFGKLPVPIWKSSAARRSA